MHSWSAAESKENYLIYLFIFYRDIVYFTLMLGWSQYQVYIHKRVLVNKLESQLQI